MDSMLNNGSAFTGLLTIIDKLETAGYSTEDIGWFLKSMVRTDSLIKMMVDDGASDDAILEVYIACYDFSKYVHQAVKKSAKSFDIDRVKKTIKSKNESKLEESD